jgi:Flp pilus assembly protein TadG
MNRARWWSDDRGQTLGPELLVILGLALVCWGFLAWLGRLTATSQDLANTAQAAARAASQQPDPASAHAAAVNAAHSSNLAGACTNQPTVVMDWTAGPQGTWRGGAVTVTLQCTIATRESASFEGRTIAASDTQVIDRYTAVVVP